MGRVVSAVTNPIKTVKDTVSSIRKNPVKAAMTYAGAGKGGIYGALAGNQVGKIFDKGAGGAGGPLNPGAKSDAGRKDFDLSKQAGKYERLAQQQRMQNLEANQRFTTALEQQASGAAPSLAQAQLKSTQNRNLAQTLAAAQSAGASPLATRNLIQQRGQSSRDMAELGGIQSLQERQMAQQMLGQQLGQQANIARGDISQGFDIARAPVDLTANYATTRMNNANQAAIAAMDAQAKRDMAQKQLQGQILGGLLGAGGTIGAAAVKSDKSAKKDIKSGSKDVKGFLDALSAKEYAYKEPESEGAAPGKRVGIMAQDLEKSTLGQTLVRESANGTKMVDTVQGFGAILAAQAELNKRLKALEGKKKA